MQSTLTGRSAPHQPHQRALHFSLLFGASGGVARTDLLPVPVAKPDRPAAMVPRRLVRDRDLARFDGESRPIIDDCTTLVFRTEGVE